MGDPTVFSRRGEVTAALDDSPGTGWGLRRLVHHVVGSAFCAGAVGDRSPEVTR
ncbi:hypothetical protein ACIQC7_04695 [Kitasatospora sp. NPDC088556]|uniref:hypothetical protein n=1 Tax=Kitasatospora sp. NPDC088556 TaxID=3364076 RepID=UPI003811CCE2